LKKDAIVRPTNINKIVDANRNELATYQIDMINKKQPVILGMEHGVTFANSDQDAFNLNPPIAGSIMYASMLSN
jgi:hypothetical protein